MFKSKYFFLATFFFLMVSCSKDAEMSDTGKSGSMARFTIKGNYLYTVDEASLNTFEISRDQPVKLLQNQYLGFGIETIFPAEDNLFIGAQNGMYIFGLANPAYPIKKSFTPHFVSYDPVVVQGDFAYVTLRSGESGWGRNELLIFDVSNTVEPELKAEFNMTNPRGLGIDNDLLFVCDDVLKVFRVTNGTELELINAFPFSMTILDVIPDDNTLYIIAQDGLYQYSYDGDEISLISKLVIPYTPQDE
jgi:hypothetical protein